MISRRPRNLLIFLVVLLAVAMPTVRTAQAEVSIEDERKMGEEFLKVAAGQLPLIEDPEVVSYLGRVGQGIVARLYSYTFPYHFYVVNSDALNAFAAPAGHIFMNRGLIEIMESEAELAAILAHEIAHVQSRHLAHRIARAQKLNWATLGGILAAIFLGSGEASQALIAGTQAGAASLQLANSRQDEEESDRKGLRYLEAAGYNGSAMVSIMNKMAHESWQSGGRIPSYLTTHPGVPERVNYLASVVQTRPPSSPDTEKRSENEVEFRMMQAKLVGGYQDHSEAVGYFRQWLEQPDTVTMAYYGMGLVLRRQGKMEEAVNSFKKAISARPDLWPILVELGETYFRMGKLDKAISVLESALALESDQPTALFVLGRSLMEQGKTAEARRYLARAEQLNGRLPSIQYHLGIAYGQLNQLGEAHYQFALHHLRHRSWKSAQFHLQEALRHANSPERKEAILKALKEIKQVNRAAKQPEANLGRH
ncbi:MAG: M48 family metalloprotease [Deltaproteobacteria bacterium]|nr:MAG: M48 family metalloprotease [Deltaproteobacteria bacterium]